MSEAARIDAVSATTEPKISYVIARLERAVRGEIAERVRPYGLTTLQYTTLSVLKRHGAPLSNAQLARRSYMTPQAMSEVIDALARKGLIRRNPHPNHGRLLPGRPRSELGQHVEAVHVRKPDVEDDDVRAALRGEAQRVRSRRGVEHVVPVVLQQEPEGQEQVGFVLDEEDRRGHGGAGSVTTKRAPPGGSGP